MASGHLMRCQVVCYAFVDVKAKGPECRCAGKEGRQGFDGGPNRRGTRGIRPAGRQGWRKGAGEGSYESRARGDRAKSGGSTVGEKGLASLPNRSAPLERSTPARYRMRGPVNGAAHRSEEH